MRRYIQKTQRSKAYTIEHRPHLADPRVVSALALVHHGGGSTRELLALAEEIRERVRARFGVELQREPVLVGRAAG